MGNLLEVDQLVEDTSIANRAMKAVFHRGLGAGRRVRDTAAEALVKGQLGDEGQIVTRKLFVNKACLINKYLQLAGEMYQTHMKYTLPLGDDGSRLLPNSMYFDYVQKMGGYEQQATAIINQIVATYPQLVQDDVNERNAALISQGKPPAASLAEYPSLDRMRQYLYVQWFLEPVPTANDFRFDVDPALKERLSERLEAIKDDATLALFQTMVKPMKAFVERLSVPIGEAGSVFRDSLLGNLNELSYLRKMNVNHDPRVTELLDGIEAVIKPYVFAPDVLREVPEARKGARDKMAELMKRLDGYGFGS